MKLINRLRDKEEAALKELMIEYGDYLLRTAYLFVKDRQVAEEVVQDTFVSAYEKIDQLQDSTKLKSWLVSIVYNNCRSHFRKSRFNNVAYFFEQIKQMKSTHISEYPEESLLQDAQNQQLTAEIGKLGIKYREVIVLYYFNELKIAQIAELIQTNENTIKARLKRGRALLKEMLLKEEFWDDGREKAIKKTNGS
ncbi:RNA polymerase sigma factor [Alkalihalobacillus sp. 1P02AB]|uniref:RNA polymerase sigma factor n=1 Tax=Alkalihalobacillus sp. 1P02AB TaxID=3132260 RepID=UPI0039A6B39A